MRLLGRHSLPIRPPGDGTPEPDNGDNPPPPPVSVPDVAIQLLICLSEDKRSRLLAAIRDTFGPNADIRTTCSRANERIGIWFEPLSPRADSESRDRGLERLQLLRPVELFAIAINSGSIRSAALNFWNTQVPKEFNADLQADSDGPIHLTGFSVSFESPNRVITRIDGFDERPWPDVDFSFVITDRLSILGDQIHCDSSSDLQADTGFLNFLTGILAGITTVVFGLAGALGFLPALPTLFFLTEAIVAGTYEPSGGLGGNFAIGCSAALLFPRKILVSGGRKFIFFYSRVEVNPGGIYAGGYFSERLRDPSVSIAGPTRVEALPRARSVARRYPIVTEEMVPPLQVNWSAEGRVVSPTAQSSTIVFDIPTGAEDGTVLQKRIAVRVTDTDRIAVGKNLLVTIEVILPDPGPIKP